MFSSSTEKHKDKGYYKGFKPFSSKNLNKVITQINTHSICPAIFSKKSKAKDYRRGWKYHRDTINVVSIGNIFRLDCDKAGEADRVIKALKREGIYALHKPSKNNRDHFVIPAVNVSQDIRKYKKQYEYLLKTVLKIELSDNGVQASMTNMSPRLDEDAISRTKTVKGKQWVAPDIPDEPKAPRKKRLKGKKLKQLAKEIKIKLKTLDPDMGYNNWFKVGQILFTEFGDSGFNIFDKWSSKGKDYDTKYCADKWYNITQTSFKVVGVGTLFLMDKMGEVTESEDVFINLTKTKYCDVTVEGFFND